MYAKLLCRKLGILNQFSGKRFVKPFYREVQCRDVNSFFVLIWRLTFKSFCRTGRVVKPVYREVGK